MDYKKTNVSSMFWIQPIIDFCPSSHEIYYCYKFDSYRNWSYSLCQRYHNWQSWFLWVSIQSFTVDHVNLCTVGFRHIFTATVCFLVNVALVLCIMELAVYIFHRLFIMYCFLFRYCSLEVKCYLFFLHKYLICIFYINITCNSE